MAFLPLFFLLLFTTALALPLIADSALQQCPCTFRMSGSTTSKALISVQILPAHQYKKWVESSRPDDIVRQTSQLKPGNFSVVQNVRQTSSWALIVHGSSTVSAKVTASDRSDKCPLHLAFNHATTSLRTSARIVNGKMLTRNEDGGGDYSVILKDSTSVCSGSLIAPRWVLTAAHCGFSAGNLVYVGASRERHVAAEMLRHPQYMPTRESSRNDIALVRLRKPVHSAALHSVAVHGAPMQSLDGRYARETGYGKRVDGGRLDMRLRAADVRVLSAKECRARFRKRGYRLIPRALDFTSQLCTSGDECRTAGCDGDSGGPLSAVGGSGRPVQIGVLSYTAGKCGTVPDMYTRVAAYTDWIRDTTGSEVRFASV